MTESTAPTQAPPVRARDYVITWGDELSVYDVLGRDPRSRALVAVPQRSGQVGAPRRVGDFEIWTACRASVCTDGLRERNGLEEVIAAAPTAEEVESLHSDGPAGAWLERGLQIAAQTDSTVSVRRATAWFGGGAARSSATVGCETYDRAGRWRLRLADVLGPEAAARLLTAARSFVTAQRELDERAAGLTEFDDASFALSANGAIVLCAARSPGAWEGFGQRFVAMPR